MTTPASASALQHRRVESERRTRIDDGEDRWLRVERRVIDASSDADQLEAIAVPLPTQAVGVDRLVGQRQRVVRGIEMADGRVDVDRLDRVTGDEVDDLEHLGEADEVLVVGPVAHPPAALQVGDVRGTRDGAEGDPVAADPQVPRRVPGMERERRRRSRDDRQDHRPIEPYALAADLDACAGGGQQRPGIGVQEVHADLLEDAQGRLVDRLQLIGRDGLGRCVAHPRLGPRSLRRQPAAFAGRASSASPASLPGGCLGLDRCQFVGRGRIVGHRALIRLTGRTRSS